MKKNGTFHLLSLAALLMCARPGYASPNATQFRLGLEGPFAESPALVAPAVGVNALSSIGNFFADLFERMGIFAAVYPIDLGHLHIGIIGDAMWHYDMDTARSPVVMGYNHLGLAPALKLDLASGLFAHASFGINRMGYRVGDSSDYGNGALTELGGGISFGQGGKGFTVEALFQNRTGLTAIQYGVLRLGFVL